MSDRTPDYKKELEDFAYIVSHDLGAPLRHIREFGKLLVKKLDDKVGDEEREYLEYMEGGIHKAEAMLAGLLEYSRVSTDTEDFSQFNCNDLMKSVMASLDQEISDTQATITFSELPPDLIADKKQISMLLFHLLDNAIKFRKNNVPPVITISSTQKDNAWIFSVKDNGIGIEPEQCERVFTMFKRLNLNDELSGMGTGLTIAKKIVQRHNGDIYIKSTPEKETEVVFSIAK